VTGIIIPKDGDPQRGVAVKGGDGHSRCPEDGCVDVERSFKLGGTDAGGGNYLDAEIYHADRNLGGCGANWTADTKQGAERNRVHGREPRWLSENAAVNRTVILSPDSERYSSEYERIFGHS
jgi:hypothetical protein